MINISSASLFVGCYYIVLCTEWSTIPLPRCSSAGTFLYYIENDQHIHNLIPRQLILCCIIYRMINISSTLIRASWYNYILYSEWLIFPRSYCSSADNMLHYLQNDWKFLGIISRQLILFFFCILKYQYFLGLILLRLLLFCTI